jgi:hypothetical protein
MRCGGLRPAAASSGHPAGAGPIAGGCRSLARGVDIADRGAYADRPADRWTQASLKQDWPAPVRPEPSGGASVAPMPPTYVDPSGDTGPDAVSYVDIRDVTASTESLIVPTHVEAADGGSVQDVDRLRVGGR